jgi:hypothetical protein
MLIVRALFVVSIFCSAAAAAEPQPVSKANYDQAFKYSTEYLRQFVYSTSVLPGWIGKTDSFWYSYRTSQGTRYWRVNAKDGKKEPLFDANVLAARLSEALKKPLDAATLPLTRVSVNDEGTKIKFVTDDLQFEYELATNKLANLGKAPPAPAFPGRRGQTGERGRRFEERRRQFEEQRQQEQQQQNQQTGRPNTTPTQTRDYRNFSPDRKVYVFAMKHNLYLAEPNKEKDAIQITKDGTEDESFGGGNDDRKARPFVTGGQRFEILLRHSHRSTRRQGTLPGQLARRAAADAGKVQVPDAGRGSGPQDGAVGLRSRFADHASRVAEMEG